MAILNLNGTALALAVLFSVASGPAIATYSIVACDATTGDCGVAVATHNIAVGNSVPFAEHGVGAGVSQFETNSCHAAAILDTLRRGLGPERALAQALESESGCPDGQNGDYRQIAIVAANGKSAVHTGKEARDHAGKLAAEFHVALGNDLASEAVLQSMMQAFTNGERSLAERLLSALEAGERAGGQKIGVLSAAIVVKTAHGWPVDTDLRVDFAHGTAVQELRALYDATVARTLLFRASRTTLKPKAALELVAKAVRLAPSWDRVLLRAAELSQQAGDNDSATDYACRFQHLNAQWAALLSDRFEFDQCGHRSQ